MNHLTATSVPVVVRELVDSVEQSFGHRDADDAYIIIRVGSNSK
jgi:hypothetical protein